MIASEDLKKEFGKLFNIQDDVQLLVNFSSSTSHEIRFYVYDEHPPSVDVILENFPWFCKSSLGSSYFYVDMTIPDGYWDIKTIRNAITIARIGTI